MNAPSGRRRNRHKHLVLDQGKIEKAQKILGVKTETETIERALEIVISEDEKDRRAWAATEKLVRSGIQIKDVIDQAVALPGVAHVGAHPRARAGARAADA